MNGSQKHELERIAREAMRTYGLEPDFSAAARAQVGHTGAEAANSLRDLRSLPWSSIDNDESRSLDQLEVCVADGRSTPGEPQGRSEPDRRVRAPGGSAPRTRVLVAIADVDALVAKDSPLDAHAAANTTSVYTPAVIFPMLPLELSTDRTSLNEGQDRAAI